MIKLRLLKKMRINTNSQGTIKVPKNSCHPAEKTNQLQQLSDPNPNVHNFHHKNSQPTVKISHSKKAKVQGSDTNLPICFSRPRPLINPILWGQIYAIG
jgi:hypothetical protein